MKFIQSNNLSILLSLSETLGKATINEGDASKLKTLFPSVLFPRTREGSSACRHDAARGVRSTRVHPRWGQMSL